MEHQAGVEVWAISASGCSPVSCHRKFAAWDRASSGGSGSRLPDPVPGGDHSGTRAMSRMALRILASRDSSAKVGVGHGQERD